MFFLVCMYNTVYGYVKSFQFALRFECPFMTVCHSTPKTFRVTEANLLAFLFHAITLVSRGNSSIKNLTGK